MGWPLGVKGRIGWQKGVNRACLALLCSPLWSPPEIDSWSQRAEVSPLYKMKSMSRAGGDDRKIYQGLGKINIWTGDTQEQPPEGVSLHLFRLVPASSWARKGCWGQPSSWPRRGGPRGRTDANANAPDERGEKGEPAPQPGMRRPESWPCLPLVATPGLNFLI